MTASWPKVRHLANLAEVAGLVQAHDVEREFESLLSEGRALVESALKSSDCEALARLLADSAQRAEQDWQRVLQGRPASREQAPRLREEAGNNAIFTVASRAGISPGSRHLRAEPDSLGNAVMAHLASSIHLQREITMLLDVRKL